MTFVEGEQELSAWMAENGYVSWVARDRPWELEHDLIAALDLPLNLQGNPDNRFHSVLIAVRARCVAQARAMRGPGTTAGARVAPPASRHTLPRRDAAAAWGVRAGLV